MRGGVSVVCGAWGMAWETEQPAGRTLHIQFSEQAGASLEKFEHSLRFCEVE